MSLADLESLEETLAVLGDTEAVTQLVDAHRALPKRRCGARGRGRQGSSALVKVDSYEIVVAQPAATAIAHETVRLEAQLRTPWRARTRNEAIWARVTGSLGQ